MRLRKREVEALWAAYDEDPVGALTEALRVARDRPDGTWEQLVAGLPDAALLLAGDVDACDRLARRVVEDRVV